MDHEWKNTGLKVAELVICLFAVVLGLVYLNTEWIPLAVLLPIYAAFFTAIPILRLTEAKQRGMKGLVPYLPALCSLLLAAAVIAACVVYFVKYF